MSIGRYFPVRVSYFILIIISAILIVERMYFIILLVISFVWPY